MNAATPPDTETVAAELDVATDDLLHFAQVHPDLTAGVLLEAFDNSADLSLVARWVAAYPDVPGTTIHTTESEDLEADLP